MTSPYQQQSRIGNVVIYCLISIYFILEDADDDDDDDDEDDDDFFLR